LQHELSCEILEQKASQKSFAINNLELRAANLILLPLDYGTLILASFLFWCSSGTFPPFHTISLVGCSFSLVDLALLVSSLVCFSQISIAVNQALYWPQWDPSVGAVGGKLLIRQGLKSAQINYI